MQGKELYQQILGIASPWTVTDVQLDHEAEEVRVRVEHPRGTKFCCPECGDECPLHDHADERRWRHLDSCQFKTVLIAAPPRVKCPAHGVKNAPLPWAEKGSRFTMLFERFAIDVLDAAQTVKGAQKVLRTSWDEIWHILQKAVARGRARKTNEVMPRNRITKRLLQLSQEQLDGVDAIAMATSAAYVKSAKAAIPQADEKTVHDRFHVMKLAREAVDKASASRALQDR